MNAFARILILVLLTLPLVALFLLPAGTAAQAIWFWPFAMLILLLLWFLIGRPRDEDVPVAAGPRPLSLEDEPPAIRRHMDVDEAVELPEGVRVFRGTLREDADQAYDSIKREADPGVVPLLQPDRGGRTALFLLPRAVEQRSLEHKVRPGIHLLLLFLTFLTTTFAGAAHQGVNLLRQPEQFAVGLPYSLGLLAILGFHEMGHYVVARWHGMNVTPPYFIPVPFALGTFGAFIQMRTPPESRKTLLDVAVAGPLAGLVVAIPALYFGLKDSAIVPARTVESLVASPAEASILMSFVTQAALGDALQAGEALQLNPLAFAGWLGLLVTALNLIPVGQLDGGHITRALLGTKGGRVVSWLAMMSLFLLAIFVWPGLMLWAIIVFFLAGRGAPPLNDVTPLPAGRKLLGVVAFVILALILVPMPEGLSTAHAQEMRCPYL